MPQIGVQVVTLGCARNEVDSEELAARLENDGFKLVAETTEADVILINTCGFIEQAKKDSIDTILEASDVRNAGKRPAVIAVGCLAERYGKELAESLPEADAVLGFDDYGEIGDRLRAVLSGEKITARVPQDRRLLLPVTPVYRPSAAAAVAVPGHGQRGLGQKAFGGRVLRRRLGQEPVAPLKIASGCDRRCAFCAIPSFRGSYISRPIADIVAEANWLVANGVHEVMLVSENSSSYGKDWGQPGALPKLLAELNQVDGLDWIRISYLQPAEIRPGLIDEIVALDKVVNYFDLSFQHASPGILRRMRRFGDPDSFLNLIDQIRRLAPDAGIRTNVIVGFPGETEADLELLKDFLIEAMLDVVGVFAYSDEEGTEGATLDGHLDADEIASRRLDLVDLVDELCDQRAEARIGQDTDVLIESAGENLVGRAFFQGPDVDGTFTVLAGQNDDFIGVGDLIHTTITASEGVDLSGQLA